MFARDGTLASTDALIKLRTALVSAKSWKDRRRKYVTQTSKFAFRGGSGPIRGECVT
jgi:hypothetical protein